MVDSLEGVHPERPARMQPSSTRSPRVSGMPVSQTMLAVVVPPAAMVTDAGGHRGKTPVITMRV